MSGAPVLLSGGVPAYNTGPRLRESVGSLLGQELPPGVAWSKVHLVVSGCTDDTLAVAAELARQDPRVDVIIQERRKGKASALREIFRRARGDRLVLLNGDAVAAPGSLSRLLAAGARSPEPFAVMARPIPPPNAEGAMARGVAAMWDLHHRVHRATVGRRSGNHISDELWLLSLPLAAPLPADVVNDGAYVGAWLASNGGRLLYAEDAQVEIDIPKTPGEHLRQRRRILWGHQQVDDLLGTAPTTWTSFARQRPGEAMGMLFAMAREDPGIVPWTVFLAVLEVQAHLLARWDRSVRRRDHVLWEPIAARRGTSNSPQATSPRREREGASASESG